MGKEKLVKNNIYLTFVWRNTEETRNIRSQLGCHLIVFAFIWLWNPIIWPRNSSVAHLINLVFRITHKKSLNLTISSLTLFYSQCCYLTLLSLILCSLCHGKSHSVPITFSKWPVLIYLTRDWKSFHRFGLPSDYLETV